MTRRAAFASCILLLVGAALVPAPVTAQEPCDSLTTLTLANTTVTSAASVAAGAYQAARRPGHPGAERAAAAVLPGGGRFPADERFGNQIRSLAARDGLERKIRAGWQRWVRRDDSPAFDGRTAAAGLRDGRNG